MKVFILAALIGSVQSAWGCAIHKQHAEQPAVVAYFTSWSIYGRGYSPLSIPAGKITHLNYAFAKIIDGKIALADAFADVEKAYRTFTI